MSGSTVTGDSYTTDSTEKSDGGVSYVLGLTVIFIIIILTFAYVSYKCTRRINSPSVPEGDDGHVSRGVVDDVLITFPAFTYSEEMTANKGDSAGCSICLADYKQDDVVRLLPDCDHLFHCTCIDTWLKVHATCPVCRNSPLPVKLASLSS